MIKHTNLSDYVIAFALLITLGTGCKKGKEKLFTLLEPSYTNIHFSNDLTATAQFNIEEYLYFYDGGGVAVGDINK